MRTKAKSVLGAIMVAAAAVAVSGCAGSSGSYGYGYGYDSRNREFCNGPYRLQPAYCRDAEYRGTFYLRGTYGDRYRHRHHGYWRHGRWHRR